MAYNVTTSELAEIRELARRGCHASSNFHAVRCNAPSHSHTAVFSPRLCEERYRAALTLGAWLETGTGDLCSHNHRTPETARNCARRFLKAFDIRENENWRNE